MVKEKTETMKLNLPSSYATLDEYVKDMTAKFRRRDPTITKLKIDDFHYPDIDLDGEEYFDSPTICLLLKEAAQSPFIKSIELRFVEITQMVAAALVQLLTSKIPSIDDDGEDGSDDADNNSNIQLIDREWDSISIIGCTGLGTPDSELFKALSVGLCNCNSVLLNHNNIKYHGLASLGDFLRSNSSLQSLHLKRENLKGNGACLFFEGLRYNQHLEELVLNFCRFDDEGVDAFASALARNSTLKTLDLGACYLPDHHVHKILKALVGHRKLEELVLTLNACHVTGSMALLKLLNHSDANLRSLNLSHQKVETLDAEVSDKTRKVDLHRIASALQINSSLRILKLSRNRLQLEDLDPLIDVLQTSNTTLQVLDVNNNAFEDEVFCRVANAMPSIRGLQKLYMLNNDIQSDDTAHALVKGMKDNTSIHVLQVKSTIPHYAEMQQLAAMNRGGRRVRKIEQDVPLSIWPRILERVNRIPWSKEYPEIKGADDCDFAADLIYYFLQSPVMFHHGS